MKVLFIAPSRKTRGGITSVIKAYENTNFWQNWSCYWLETHIDRSFFEKILYFLKAYIKFIFILYQFDIIHIHLSEPASAFRKLFFFIPAQFLRKKIIVHFHSFSTETTINSKFRILYKFLFKHSDTIIVLSDKWKQDLLKYIDLPTSKIYIIFNPADSTLVKNPYSLNNKTILYAGTLNTRKGYEDLLKSFKLLREHNSNYSLSFAGNGEIDRAKQIANNLGILDKITFHGWLTGEDKKHLFSTASIFCLPSYAEGFPMAVIDALSYGIPVITTPVGGLPDLLENNHNILFFTPGNIEELYRSLKNVVDDDSLKLRLSTNGFKIANDTFNITSITHKIDTLYQNLLG